MNWDTTTKRYGLALFEKANPENWDGEGDDRDFFDSRDDAATKARKYLTSGRFEHAVLWDGVSGEWEFAEEFAAEEFQQSAT